MGIFISLIQSMVCIFWMLLGCFFHLYFLLLPLFLLHWFLWFPLICMIVITFKISQPSLFLYSEGSLFVLLSSKWYSDTPFFLYMYICIYFVHISWLSFYPWHELDLCNKLNISLYIRTSIINQSLLLFCSSSSLMAQSFHQYTIN